MSMLLTCRSCSITFLRQFVVFVSLEFASEDSQKTFSYVDCIGVIYIGQIKGNELGINTKCLTEQPVQLFSTWNITRSCT